MIVPDANVVIKILHHEPDSEMAQNFLAACVTKKADILVPEHFLYELINVAHRLGIAIEQVLQLFEVMQGSVLTVVIPQPSTWLLAEKIADAGHEKSGFPSMYDSIYHSLAIQSESVFVTADSRHYAKAERFSCIRLLQDWESVFR